MLSSLLHFIDFKYGIGTKGPPFYVKFYPSECSKLDVGLGLSAPQNLIFLPIQIIFLLEIDILTENIQTV